VPLPNLHRAVLAGVGRSRSRLVYSILMSRDIQWTDTDPATGERRFVAAEKFAKQWRFKVRFKRREDWSRDVAVTRAMWETLLDALERRYRRREATEEDVAAVRKILAGWKEAPGLDRE
jgi:hypothetical protein